MKQEMFLEESVVQQDTRQARRWYVMFTILMVMCIIAAVVTFLVDIIYFLFGEVDDDTLTQMIIFLIVMLVVAIAFVVGACFCNRLKHRYFVSYDYTYVSGELRIAKVTHAIRRRILYMLMEDQFLQIGRVGSDSYEKLKKSPDAKEDVLTPNDEPASDKEFFYIQAVTKVGRRILVLECRPSFIAQIINNQTRRITESEFYRKR